MGKPSPEFYREVVASTPYESNQCLMVGDDIDSDVIGAIDSGIPACLVQTGKYQPGDEMKCMSAKLLPSIADIF